MADAFIDALRTLEEVRQTRVSLDICECCGEKVLMMVRRGTGICSENCEKRLRGEQTTADHMEGVGHHASE